MSRYAFHDEHIERILDSRFIHTRLTDVHRLESHSSLVKKFSKREFTGLDSFYYGSSSGSGDSDSSGFAREGNKKKGIEAIAWNSNGSLLMAATNRRIEVWRYPNEETAYGYSLSMQECGDLGVNCVKFIPESPREECIVYGNAKKEVRFYDINENSPRTIVRCHSECVDNLAFPKGSPGILWSSCNDSILREHDIREPPCGEKCRKVLLDLRAQNRRSLAYSPTSGSHFDITSFDASPDSSYLIFVGGSDRFGRLYDRRMLQLGYSRKKELLPVNYYCPRHLSLRYNVYRPSKEEHFISHVAFSPDGREVLISYSGEHIYVMNVNHDGASEELYSPADVIKMMKVDEHRDGLAKIEGTDRDIKIRDRVRKLLKDCTRYHGIDILDAVLSLPGRPIDGVVIHEWLCSRANLLLERKWKNDAHMAIRDCDRARKINDGDCKPFYHISKALLQLDRRPEALKSAQAARFLDPSNSEVKNLIKDIRSDLARIRSGSMKSQETRSWMDDVLSSSFKPSEGTEWSTEYKAIDMKQRFIGHRNKFLLKANFLGPKGEYVVSGSDDNRLYIWEKRSGRLVRTLFDNDTSGLFDVQCHPSDFVVATGGINEIVEIWAAGVDAAEPPADDLDAMEKNQRKLSKRS